jgi:XTP/dITP diphosphohydrolase
LAENNLLLATGNLGKITELRNMISGRGVTVLGLADISQGQMKPPEETGNTFCENAGIKARCWMERSGLTVLADDSGLMVDCLEGAPGIYSSRFAGRDATDSDNNALLLSRLQDVPDDRRSAAFHCCLTLCRPGLPDETFTGRVEGFIAREPAGSGGFGYDPLFYYPPLRKTFAQLTTDEKNEVSHRSAALKSFFQWLDGNPLVP